MNKIIIADAGSTKIDWMLVDTEKEADTLRHTGSGLNAALASDEEMSRIFGEAGRKDGWNDDSVSKVIYYGAGCIGGETNSRVGLRLSSIWPGAEITVESDLLGAARALHGREEGIACILGTGSNSGLYDGKTIVNNVPSLGYILGDEGSGTALGKRLIADVFKGELPALVREKFLESLGMTLPEIIDKVYRQPNPNRFLASVVPFIRENLWNPYLYALVLKEMTAFLKRNVAKYENARRRPLGFVGSIAWHFKDQLTDAADACGFTLSKIIKSPAEALATFHSEDKDPRL